MKVATNGGSTTGHAWITGASSGIGAALARRLCASGWRTAISARSADKLGALVTEAGDTMSAVPLDVTDETAVQAAVDSIEDRAGPLDVAFLNAGDYQAMPAAQFDIALFRRLNEVNYLGVINALGALLPRMIERRSGQILINASVAGYRGLPLAAPYGATKAALINLAESLHAELGPRGVRVRVVNPGFVRTPLTDQNPFTMPALITPEQAAAAIERGIGKGGFEITFPRRFTYVMKLLRCLPYALYFPLVRKATGQ